MMITSKCALVATLAALALACGGARGASRPADNPSQAAQASAQELYDLGLQLARVGQYLRAEHYLRLSQKRGMSAEKVTPALIDVYIRSQQLSAAALLGESHLKTHPDDWSLRMTTGVVLAILGRHDRARAHLEHIVQAQPSLAVAHYQLGVLIRDAFPQEAGKARDHFARYLQLDPTGAYHAEAEGYLTQAPTAVEHEVSSAAEVEPPKPVRNAP